MLRISVKDAVTTLQRSARQLSPAQFTTALFRSLNESILQARTEARSAVKSHYNIPQRYVSGINVLKANSSVLAAKLFASARPIPMDAFAPKFETSVSAISISRKGVQKQRVFKKAKKNPGTGVSIEIVKGRRESIPYAFLIAGAKPRVFARGEYRDGTSYGFVTRNKRVNASGNDTPIKPLLSVTVHAAVINPGSLKKIEERVNSVFPISVERNVNYLLSRIGP